MDLAAKLHERKLLNEERERKRVAREIKDRRNFKRREKRRIDREFRKAEKEARRVREQEYRKRDKRIPKVWEPDEQAQEIRAANQRRVDRVGAYGSR